MGSLEKLQKLFDRILNVGFVIGGLIVVYIMLSICVAIVTRYFFNRPILGVIGIAEQLLVFVGFFTAAWALRRERHVRMDLLLGRLKPNVQAFVNAITYLVSSIVCLVIVWYSAKVAWQHYSEGVFSRTVLDIPSAPSLAMISYGSFLLALQFLRSSANYFNTWKVSNTSTIKPNAE